MLLVSFFAVLDLEEFKLVASAGPDGAFQVIVHVIVKGEVEVILQSILILDGGPAGDFIIWSSFVPNLLRQGYIDYMHELVQFTFCLLDGNQLDH